MNFNLEIGLILVEELALIALPAVAAAMFAAARGMRSQVLLIGVALAASGSGAMLVFWAFYADPEVGKTAAFLLEFGSAAAIAALWWEGRGRDHPALRELATPFGLWIAATFFVVFLGYMHGHSFENLELAQFRFSHVLPTDNAIPRYFEDWFYHHGHNGTPPPFAEWQASDRPPLQIAYTLGARPFGWDLTSLHYQLLSVALQALWVPATWALLRAANLSKLARGLAIFAVMAGDVAIVHGFFVWPKLIAAAFLLAAVAMVFSPRWKEWARDPAVAIVFAALLALSLLSHGSSVFLVIPLLAFAAWRARPDWRAGLTWQWVGVAIAAALILYAPWAAYQKYGDPPGDRLVKWQLGGFQGFDERGSLETIVDGYREEGLGGTIQNKWQNVQAISGVAGSRTAVREAVEDLGDSNFGGAIETIRNVRFFSLLPFLGFLLLGPLAALARAALDRGGGRGPERRFALVGGALTLAACAVWALLMFGNEISEAVIHQGTLAVPVLAVCVCVAAAYSVSRAFALGLVAFNAVFCLLLYVPVVKAVPETSFSPIAALVAALALAAFAWLALRAPGTTEEGQYTPAP